MILPVERWWFWLRSIVGRAKAEREMHEEMQAHLTRAAERFVARGMSPEEARIAARREFGNVAAIQDESREARGGQVVEDAANGTGEQRNRGNPNVFV